ncbi:MAG: hypothetical protein R2719_05540 [Micropruina sp.]
MTTSDSCSWWTMPGCRWKTVLEQLDLLGEILPALREGFAQRRPAHVPEAPTHASLVAERASVERATERAATVDDVTGRSPYQVVESGEPR